MLRRHNIERTSLKKFVLRNSSYTWQVRLVPQAGIEPAMFTTRVTDFKSVAFQPSFATVAFLNFIYIITYF